MSDVHIKRSGVKAVRIPGLKGYAALTLDLDGTWGGSHSFGPFLCTMKLNRNTPNRVVAAWMVEELLGIAQFENNFDGEAFDGKLLRTADNRREVITRFSDDGDLLI